MMIIWILFGLLTISRCASIPENAQLIGLLGYFTQPNQVNVNQLDRANFKFFPASIVFYPIFQKTTNPHYLPRDREAIEAAAEQNTENTVDPVTDVTDKMDLSTGVTLKPLLDDIPPINLLPLDDSPLIGFIKPPVNTQVPTNIQLVAGAHGYGYSNSNQNINSISFTTSHPPPAILYPLNMPSQLYQFRPSPLQTNEFNHFRPSHFGFGLPEGNTNFITGKSTLDNFPFAIL